MSHQRGAVKLPDARAIPYTVRACTPDDQEAILQLLAITVGETAASLKTMAFWRWKHQDNPFGRSFLVGAFDPGTGALAGVRALMWWNLLDDRGEVYRAVRAVDTATHPEHQRRGIFSALTLFAILEPEAAGAALVFNTPNGNSLPGYLKMGWSVVERWPILIRPIRPVRLAGRLLRRKLGIESPPAAAGGAIRLTPWKQFREAYGSEIDDVVGAHEEVRSSPGYRTQRSGAYLDWRYGGHPDIVYEVITAETSARLEGFAVGRRVAGSGGLGCFVVNEVFARDGRRGTGRVLKKVLGTSADDYAACHFAAGTMERSAANRRGFVPAPRRGYTFVSLPLRPLPLDPALPTSWDLTLGELEIF